MYLEDSLCPQSRVHVLTVQFMSLEYSVSSHSTFYDSKVQFMSLENSLCPQSSVHVLTVQFMSLEYSISSHSTFYDSKVQFMSLSTVYVFSVWYILSQYSYGPMVLFMCQEWPISQ